MINDARDSAGTLGMLLGNIAMAAATKTAVLGMYFSLYPFRLVDINDFLPPWAVWVLTFIAIGFVFYWYHRWSHRVRCLWAEHMNHHCKCWATTMTMTPWASVIVTTLLASNSEDIIAMKTFRFSITYLALLFLLLLADHYYLLHS